MDCKNIIEVIEIQDFYQRVIEMKMHSWRLAQICAVRIDSGYEMSYSFCKDYDMITLRLLVGMEEKISSITQIYPCAFLQENEASELFGVQIESLDPNYHHKLYRIEKETPFKEKG